MINGQMSATVIDMTPTVLRLDNQTNPTFVFIPEARAYTIPAQSIGGLNLQVGGKDDIRAAPWWLAILHSAKYEITNVNLNATHISITIANTGNVSLVFKIAVLLSPTSVSGGRIPIASLGSILGTSEVFVLEHNDSMSPITEINNGVPAAMIAAGGYLLQPGATVSFSFSGNLSLGVALSNTPIHHLRPINPGQRYVIALLANGMVAATTIVAAAS